MASSTTASSDDYGSLLSTARQAFTDGKTKPLEWRKTQLKQFIKLFQENAQDFYDALKKDLSKPKQESFSFEVDYNVNTFKVKEWRNFDQAQSPADLSNSLMQNCKPMPHQNS